MTTHLASSAPPVKVYWAPGCTSCLRTKEFLSGRGVPFVSVNVKAEPGAMQELAALGARSIPVVAQGERWVYAQSLQDVTRLLSLDAPAVAALTPDELATRVGIVLRKALGFVEQLSDAELDGPFRDSWAPPRGLAHHVFRIVEAFVEAHEQGIELGYDAIMAGTHEVVPGQDVGGYGREVLRRFDAWWERARGSDFGAAQATYYGAQPLHEVLERTTWHAAQHARQLMVVIESRGRAVQHPLTAEDLAGLPLPAKAWDDAAAVA